jgi:hypothetical protein
MTIVILIFGLLLAVYLMRLAFLNFGKEKYPTSTLLAVLAVVAFCFSLPSFQSFARTWVVHDVNSRLLALGNKLDEVQNAMSGMHNQLTEHQNQIESHQKELASVQTKIRTTQLELSGAQTNITDQLQQISTLQQIVASAETNLMKQQGKLETVEYWVQNVFSQTEVERFEGSDTNRVLIQNVGDDVNRVFFITSFVPVNNTIHGIFAGGGLNPQVPMLPIRQPVSRNLLMTYFKGSGKLQELTFHFQYVKDTRETNLFRAFNLEKTTLDNIALEDSGPRVSTLDR